MDDEATKLIHLHFLPLQLPSKFALPLVATQLEKFSERVKMNYETRQGLNYWAYTNYGLLGPDSQGLTQV